MELDGRGLYASSPDRCDRHIGQPTTRRTASTGYLDEAPEPGDRDDRDVWFGSMRCAAALAASPDRYARRSPEHGPKSGTTVDGYSWSQLLLRRPAGQRRPRQAARGWGRSTRRSVWALRATVIVDALLRMVPTAGDRVSPARAVDARGEGYDEDVVAGRPAQVLEHLAVAGPGQRDRHQIPLGQRVSHPWRCRSGGRQRRRRRTCRRGRGSTGRRTTSR